MAMAEVLERSGCEVDFPEAQTCCGQPAFNSGYRDEARTVACHFLDVFADAEYIVAPSGSCTSMASHHMRELFPPGDPRRARAEAVGGRIYEFSRFLTEVLEVEDVGARFDHVVTYHDSCHALRELKIKEPPRRLLARVRGLTLKEMDAAEECCGFGGTFSVNFPEVSGRLGEEKARNAAATGADELVACDLSCLMHIAGRARRTGVPLRARHIAEVLAG
jgi:L-lactate dehydrogenase complex protein LldE